MIFGLLYKAKKKPAIAVQQTAVAKPAEYNVVASRLGAQAR